MRNRSFSKISSAATLALIIACSLPSAAAVRVAAVPAATNDAARMRLRLMVDDAKAELAQAATMRAGLVQSLGSAQDQLSASTARALTAQAASMRLNATAKEARRQAYVISDLPGLSAEQNHRSVAAMELADAAEADARVAQFGVAATAATVAHDRGAVDAVTNQLALLDGRIDTCNRLLKLNGAALADNTSASR